MIHPVLALIPCGLGLAADIPSPPVPATASATASGQASAPAIASAPVDVAVSEPAPARRIFAIEFNPVALFIHRISGNLEIVPADHHALVLNGYYFNTSTAQFTSVDGDAVVVTPSQRFDGGGGEVGYRYYTGRGGPRGFFAGPSFTLARVSATDRAGDETSLFNYGVAIDVGWQALVADDWVVSLGGGATYDFTSKSLPDQQAPAAYYANGGAHARVLVAVGYAF
jgi:hypothetical protein